MGPSAPTYHAAEEHADAERLRVAVIAQARVEQLDHGRLRHAAKDLELAQIAHVHVRVLACGCAASGNVGRGGRGDGGGGGGAAAVRARDGHGAGTYQR